MGPHTIDGKKDITAESVSTRSLESCIEYARRMKHGQIITFGTLAEEVSAKFIEWLSLRREGCWFEYIKKPTSFVVEYHSSGGPPDGVVSTISEIFYQCFKMLPGEKCTFPAWAYFVKVIPTIEEDLMLIQGKSFKVTKHWKRKGGLYQLNIVCQ